MNPPLPSRIRVIAQALNAQYDDGVLDYYRYRCCCRSCHVKYGALAIGVFEVLVMAYHFASCLILLIREDIAAHTASTAITMVGIALALGAVACVFYGVIKQKPLFVLPHLILQGVSIAVLISLVGMTVVALASDAKFILNIVDFVDMEQLKNASPNALTAIEASHFLALIQDFALVISLFVFSGALVIALWFFRVVHRAFQYLIECRIEAQKPKRCRNSVSFIRELR